MAQYFYINSNSVNPTLRVELVNDAKYEWFKGTSFNEAIQNADITFSMWDENEVLKIGNAPCNLILSKQEALDSNGNTITTESGCESRYIIEYPWKERDTKKKGVFTGRFMIDFKSDLMKNGGDYPKGKFVVPIYEDLKIEIK